MSVEAKTVEKEAPKKEEKKKPTNEERVRAYLEKVQEELKEAREGLKFSEESNRVLQEEITKLKGQLGEAGKEKDRLESAIKSLEGSKREGVARGKKAFYGEKHRLMGELETARATIRALNARLNDPNLKSNTEKEAMEIAARTKATLDTRDADLKDYRKENLRLRNRIGELEEKLQNPLSIVPSDLKSKDKK